MQTLIPDPPEPQRPRKPRPTTGFLPGTDIQLPHLGLSLDCDCKSSQQDELDFDLHDESIHYLQAQAELDHLLPQSQQQTVFKRVGLDEHLHDTHGIHSSELGYEGIVNAYKKLNQHSSREITVNGSSSANKTVLLLDGCASLNRPDLNNDLHFSVAMQGGLKALQDLKSSGEISAFGFVSDHAEYCQRALREGDWDLFVLNHRYTLLEQWPLFNLLPECEQTDTAVVVGHPFNSGILRGEPSWNFARPPSFVTARIETIAHICALHEIPMQAAALQFPLAHPMVHSILVKAASAKTGTMIKKWSEQPIADSFWDDLKLGGVMHEEAPTPSADKGSHAFL